MNNFSMVGLVVESVWMPPLTPVHPAWRNNGSALSTSFVNLIFASGLAVQVGPSEVEVPGNHPALGLELLQMPRTSEYPRQWLRPPLDPVTQVDEIQRNLPAEIADVQVWDSLGEGPVSAIKIVTVNGFALTMRHQYPPMTLGVETAYRDRIE